MLRRTRLRPSTFFLPFLLAFLTLASAVQLEHCNSALGLELGSLPDAALSASSAFDLESVGPQNARIRTDTNGGAWCPERSISPNSYEWLQVDLGKLTIVTAVETQGRYGAGKGLEFATHYLLEYWRPGAGDWVRYNTRLGEAVLEGNTDTATAVLRQLDPPIVATRVRFVPHSTYDRTVCMRVEVYGCDSPDGLLSYASAQGDAYSDQIDLKDRLYDGHAFPGPTQGEVFLSRGLGQLYDGVVASGDFRKAEDPAQERGFDWVGWKNASTDSPLIFLLTFDGVHNFSSLSLHANNQFKHGAQVFAECQLWFSVDGTVYDQQVVYKPLENTFVEESHWIRIPVNGAIGQYVRVELTYANDWLMLSELEIDSQKLDDFVLPPATSNEVEFLPKIPRRELVANGRDEEIDEMIVETYADALSIEYIALIAGILAFSLLTITLITCIVISRQRKLDATKKLMASPYATHLLKQPQRVTIDMKNLEMTVHDHMASHNHTIHKNSFDNTFSKLSETISANTNKATANTFTSYQLPTAKSPLPLTDTSDYAEPSSLGQCSATIPLLTPPSSTSSASSRASNKPAPPPRASHYAMAEIKSTPSRRLSIQGLQQSMEGQLLTPGEIREIDTRKVLLGAHIGEGEYGLVRICRVSLDGNEPVLAAAKYLAEDANEETKADFFAEVSVLASLRDPNIARLLGACTQTAPACMLIEYGENGDLCQCLRTNRHAIDYPAQLRIAKQIASGMSYLESLNFVHRDLAARNCQVAGSYPSSYHIQISDLGMTQPAYAEDYYSVNDTDFALPVRWIAPESLVMGKFTPRSDAWSFAVTLWEILTLCHSPPLAQLCDAEVVDNLRITAYENPGAMIYPHQPPSCPPDVFAVAVACWCLDDSARPSFCEIHAFLSAKLNAL